MSRERGLLVTPAWNWADLEPGTAPWRAAWEDLGDWVRWYAETYELWSAMPVCWFAHSRLCEELVSLRFLHHAVVAPRPRVGDADAARELRPSARAFSEWMTTRRDWERDVLGVDPRDHGGCTGLAHVEPRSTTTRSRAQRLNAMADGLRGMLDSTVPGGRPGGA